MYKRTLGLEKKKKLLLFYFLFFSEFRERSITYSPKNRNINDLLVVASLSTSTSAAGKGYEGQITNEIDDYKCQIVGILVFIKYG